MLQRANDFPSLYLRNTENRDKAEWAIEGYQLELLVDYVFHYNIKILRFRDIQARIDKLKFDNIHAPERGQKNKDIF